MADEVLALLGWSRYASLDCSYGAVGSLRFLARDGVLALLAVNMEIHGEKAAKMARARIINKLFTIKILYVSFK